MGIVDLKILRNCQIGVIRAALLSIIFLLAYCAGLKPIPRFPEKIPLVRVLLSEGGNKATVSATGYYTVRTKTKRFLFSNSPQKKVEFILSKNNSLSVFDQQGRKFGSFKEAILVVPVDPEERIILGYQQFRGKLEVFVGKKGQLMVVNQLEIEDYLKGVVAAEMGEFGKPEFEALKALAVAARSYAVRKILERQNLKFDLLATEDDQAYKGYGSETLYGNRAIEETKGLVAVYDGRVINAFYHSTCGGRTEDASNVWPEVGVPYLRGIEDSFDGNSFFCEDSPDFRWIEEWDGEVVKHMLRNALDSLGTSQSLNPGGTLKDIQVVERFRSGRVQKLKVEFGTSQYTFYGDGIRRVLRRSTVNGAILRSTLFVLKLVRDETGKIETVMAIGGGNGHGVGLCQWGAVGRARKGFKFDTILKTYYQGIELRKIY